MRYKISIIGFGNIGKQICASLFPFKKHDFDINIVDNCTDIFGAFLDIGQAFELQNKHSLSLNSTHKLEQADFIFHCAGASIPKASNRLAVTKKSIEITEQVFNGLHLKNTCKIIVISNPVEIIAHVTQKITGLNSSQVIGTGTSLDTLRMNYYAKRHNNALANSKFVLLGEHGASAFISDYYSDINTQQLPAEAIKHLLKETKASAKKIKETQEATIYGASFCALEILKALLSEKAILMAVSTSIPLYLQTKNKLQAICLSLNCKINKNGAEALADYAPDTTENKALIKAYQEIINHIPPKYLN